MARITACDKHKEFDCGGAGMCIPLSKVCDKRKDCPDGEDEPAGKCSRNECAKNNGGCQHKCIDSFLGYRCECESGYVGQTILRNKPFVLIHPAKCIIVVHLLFPYFLATNL